ncbi:MAG: hypothetical protein COU71_00325 [Parcubacteria group bacterium CG10_big_fil_rev_8_21_14_0_10_38_31]|nr:MAG: hypothetical protein COU71_00325 [Parcubacteria group bacterium CG10_big_fil_rev_8_21_14_0_10_38_31]
MVKRILNFVYKGFDGLHEAALLLALSSLGSQVLALFRDRLLAGKFGAGLELDIYYASFRIPDLVYVFAVSLVVSVSVLIPVFLGKLSGGRGTEDERKEQASQFINSIFSVFTVLIFLLAVILFFLVPYLVKFIAPGFGENELKELITLTRILLLSPAFLGFSGILSSVVQSFNKFFIYALAPVFYNLGIIFGIIFLYPVFGLNGLALGVLFGAFLHFAIQIPIVYKLGFLPKFEIVRNFSDIKKVLQLSLPRALGLSATQFVITIFVALASGISIGSITVLTFAFNLQSVSISVIGASYSVAAFPTLTRFFTENKREEFLNHILIAGRHIIFWSVPLTALFIVLRAQIVRVVLGTGAFDWTETRLVAAALAVFIFSLTSQSLVLLFVRGYYASGETKKPIIINVASSVVMIISAFVFIKLFDFFPMVRIFFENLLRIKEVSGTTVLALPIAYSFGMFLNGIILWRIFEKDFGRLFGLRRVSWQSIVSAVVMGIIAYISLYIFSNVFDINTFVGIFLQGLFSGVVGIMVGIGILFSLKNREMEEIVTSFRHKFWRTKPIAPQPEEL